jgi:DNA-directed RNA polymerase specialized sigma subunit
MTQQEVAEVLGVSRAAVADLEKNALRKLRIELKKRGYTMKDFFGRE